MRPINVLRIPKKASRTLARLVFLPGSTYICVSNHLQEGFGFIQKGGENRLCETLATGQPSAEEGANSCQFFGPIKSCDVYVPSF